ncbi:MFS transporter [Nocardioides sp. DS6]|uniref:MFS transporter n=1 Tax=Nocardioides eburneus TaxID=3231482 RepID=A0ABV3SXL8_9ACTN
MSTIADTEPTGFIAQVPRGAFLGTLVGACSTVLVAQANSSIPATLNGMFQTDLRATGDDITWITSSFMIAVVVFEFTFGVLGDLFGRKRLVLAGTALLLIGNIVSATAGSPHALWVGAALNGIGAGAMLPGTLSLAAAVARSPRSRAKAVAIWAGFLSAGGGIAPLLGGAFAHYGSWRGAYWVLAGLSLLAIVLTAAFSAESSAPEGRKLDIPGQALFAIGLILVLFAAVQGPTDGWSAPRIVVCFVVGAVLLAVFLAVEARSDSPILNLDLFKNRAFLVTSVVAVVGMFSFLGVGYALSIWMGPMQHQDPLRIAVVFVALQAPTFVLIPVMSRLLHRVSPIWMLAAGFALMAAGDYCYVALDADNTSLAPFITPTVVVGLGFSLALNSMTAVAINSVPLHLAGMASATINMIRDLGFALGPVLIGAVALSRAGKEFMTSLAGAGLPAPDVAAATQIGQVGGPLAVNGLPPGTPGSAAHGLALHALSGAYTTAFVVVGTAAGVAAILTVVGTIGRKSAVSAEPVSQALVDPLHPALDEIPAVDLVADAEPQ